MDGKEVRSCITALSEVTANQEITTLEGLPARWAKQKGLSAEEAKKTLHPVQQAWIEEQTPQCGFCQNGMMIKATELLESNPHPTMAQIKEAFTTSGPSPNLCRCGTYMAIMDAVKHAAGTHGEGEVSDGDHQRKTRECFWSDTIAAAIRENGRSASSGVSLVGRRR